MPGSRIIDPMVRRVVLLLACGVVGAAGAGGGIPLAGYLCPSCPSVTDPALLLDSIHPQYTTIIVAFATYDASGNASADFNTATWSLKPGDVQQLQRQGRTVMLSVGGGDGAILACSSPPSFTTTLAASLLGLVKHYGFDGIDWDIEHRSGDFVACGAIINTATGLMKRSAPALHFSIAPQMTNVDPNVALMSAGFNELVPVISAEGSLAGLDYVQPQMYNTWGAVETTTYAQSYARKLVAGFELTAGDRTFHVKIPAEKLRLGFPSTPKGAGTGFIDPAKVASMVANLTANGVPIAGIMTWSIGWDQQAGWPFAKAMAAPTPPTPPTPPSPPPSPPPPPGPPPPGPGTTCHAVPGSGATDAWCDANCHHDPPNCPSALCKCA